MRTIIENGSQLTIDKKGITFVGATDAAESYARELKDEKSVKELLQARPLNESQLAKKLKQIMAKETLRKTLSRLMDKKQIELTKTAHENQYSLRLQFESGDGLLDTIRLHRIGLEDEIAFFAQNWQKFTLSQRLKFCNNSMRYNNKIILMIVGVSPSTKFRNDYLKEREVLHALHDLLLYLQHKFEFEKDWKKNIQVH